MNRKKIMVELRKIIGGLSMLGLLRLLDCARALEKKDNEL